MRPAALNGVSSMSVEPGLRDLLRPWGDSIGDDVITVFYIIKFFRREFNLVEFRKLRIHEEIIANIEHVRCEYLRIHEENHLIAWQASTNKGRNHCTLVLRTSRVAGCGLRLSTSLDYNVIM